MNSNLGIAYCTAFVSYYLIWIYSNLHCQKYLFNVLAIWISINQNIIAIQNDNSLLKYITKKHICFVLAIFIIFTIFDQEYCEVLKTSTLKNICVLISMYLFELVTVLLLNNNRKALETSQLVITFLWNRFVEVFIFRV